MNNDTSILNKAIEAIRTATKDATIDPFEEGYNEGLQVAYEIVRSLLPAEEEQKKEDMREAFGAGFNYCNNPVVNDSFETWYNQNEKG